VLIAKQEASNNCPAELLSKHIHFCCKQLCHRYQSKEEKETAKGAVRVNLGHVLGVGLFTGYVGKRSTLMCVDVLIGVFWSWILANGKAVMFSGGCIEDVPECVSDGSALPAGDVGVSGVLVEGGTAGIQISCWKH